MIHPRRHLLLVAVARPRRDALHHFCQRSKGQRGVPVSRIIVDCAVTAAAVAAAALLRLPLPVARLREGGILRQYTMPGRARAQSG